ncbi:Methyltransferase type 11 [Chloroherpeton thalassium ATCC 35110]|uniref:Methyltransferase type 11 n=1 Tax=Chloroherpeton thalassium (strain ATCC 35110 / GB-78) TaxID=517418 RepID=B3QXE7_CHLT3|nr:class I SAM-dependent methyltransferase [Chloroherpeton thalassium]ACF13421.1 Methyltransferase type 11 [Chloroherpeton thalassium ATCC 35110]
MYTMNAAEYDQKIMKDAFRKIYPVIAQQIIDRTGIARGLCIDLGGGPGMLGLSLATLTHLNVIVYDAMEDCVALARKNSRERGLQDKVTALQGLAEAMPFADSTIDLVVSRGSIFFWENQLQGISEVHRVLKPGGMAYIGGGFGTQALLQEILEEKKLDPDWNNKRKERFAKNPPEHFQNILSQLDINGTVELSNAGMWIIFKK